MAVQALTIEPGEEAFATVKRALEVLGNHGWAAREIEYLIFDASVRDDADTDRELLDALCVLAQAKGMGILGVA